MLEVISFCASPFIRHLSFIQVNTLIGSTYLRCVEVKMNVFGLPASRRMRLSPSMGCMVIGIGLIHFDILCTGNEKLELENRLDFYNVCSFN